MGLIGCPILLVAQNALRKILLSRIFLHSFNQILDRLFLVFNDTINILCTYLVAVLIRFFMISHLYMYVTVINMLSFIISLFNIFSMYLVTSW